jgi:class 3 adenylate cyclase
MRLARRIEDLPPYLFAEISRKIAAQAKGGEILVANVVRELAAGKGFLFADRGEVTLRGFEDPVRLYEVRWGEEG